MDGVKPEYGHLVLHAYDLKKIFYGLGSGLRQNLDWSDFKYLPCLVPPLDEQVAIIHYLEHTNDRIDRYIRAKERLITLLEEQRQAVIHQAVTRGLDPDAPLKPSGIPWLGGIPKHWTFPRLRNLGEAIIGLTYGPQDIVDSEDGMLVFRASNIQNGRISYEDSVYVQSQVPERLITQDGDILICSRSGSRALIGKSIRINAASSGRTFGVFMTVFRSKYNNYLQHVFNSMLFKNQCADVVTSTINQLTQRMLYVMKIPWPSATERKEIAEYLDQTTGVIDRAIENTTQEIDLIAEYRNRLIADVVTGQLDVREAAAALPSESP